MLSWPGCEQECGSTSFQTLLPQQTALVTPLSFMPSNQTHQRLLVETDRDGEGRPLYLGCILSRHPAGELGAWLQEGAVCMSLTWRVPSKGRWRWGEGDGGGVGSPVDSSV